MVGPDYYEIYYLSEIKAKSSGFSCYILYKFKNTRLFL